MTDGKQHKYQTEHIILLDDTEATIGCKGNFVRVPADFQWIPYPEQVSYRGKNYKYIGAIDAYPYYRILVGA